MWFVHWPKLFFYSVNTHWVLLHKLQMYSFKLTYKNLIKILSVNPQNPSVNMRFGQMYCHLLLLKSSMTYWTEHFNFMKTHYLILYTKQLQSVMFKFYNRNLQLYFCKKGMLRVTSTSEIIRQVDSILFKSTGRCSMLKTFLEKI